MAVVGIALAAALAPPAQAAVRAADVVPAAASLPGLARSVIPAGAAHRWLRSVRPHGLKHRSTAQFRFRGRGRKPQLATVRGVVARNVAQARRWRRALRAKRALVVASGTVVVQLLASGPLRGDLAFALRRIVRARIAAARAQTPWTRLITAAGRDGKISAAE